MKYFPAGAAHRVLRRASGVGEDAGGAGEGRGEQRRREESGGGMGQGQGAALS